MLQPIKNNQVIKQYDLEIGKIVFYKNYLIIEVAEGICFDYEKAKQISRLTDLHYKNHSFGYISNRVNSYSLEPIDYMRIKNIFPNMIAFAAVIYNKSQKASIRIENMFYQDGIASFESLEEAVKWIVLQLENKSKLF
ncbi:hypothetical protein [Aquimarina longa]|uniref:hypothetical protein n=1 Tax=Aquimarina longa TaxID=1080221 RepID=UPI0007857508|nr:hypothetical protein [Aquimarina longa]